MLLLVSGSVWGQCVGSKVGNYFAMHEFVSGTGNVKSYCILVLHIWDGEWDLSGWLLHFDGTGGTRD